MRCKMEWSGSVPTVTNRLEKTQNNQFIAYLMASACAAFSAARSQCWDHLSVGIRLGLNANLSGENWLHLYMVGIATSDADQKMQRSAVKISSQIRICSERCRSSFVNEKVKKIQAHSVWRIHFRGIRIFSWILICNEFLWIRDLVIDIFEIPYPQIIIIAECCVSCSGSWSAWIRNFYEDLKL